MLRLIAVVALVALAVGSPAVVRSREEIESFRHFLESTKIDDGTYLARMQTSPLANPEENSGKFEGDIVLDDFIIEDMLKEYAMGRNAYTWPNTKWPNNTVVWDYAEGVFGHRQKTAIENGIADIEKNTCIKFRKREPDETVFVQVTGAPSGCFAHVGYWKSRGIHSFNLAPGCFRHATIVHEWMHILGFLHMQSTYDRDNYVRIVEENIIPSTLHNFAIYSSDLVSNLGIPYDYVSCLHYNAYAFSANGEKTIVALQKHDGVMGQRVFITDKDWLRINRHYNCPGAWD